MEKFVIPVLVSTVLLLGGIVAYFLKGQNDKLDQIYLSTRSLPDDVKKMKEGDLPALTKRLEDHQTLLTKRLEDHQALLVALASARGASAGPEYQKLLENLLKRILKAELDQTNAAIAKLKEGQSSFQKEVARLSQMVDRQSRLAAAVPFSSTVSLERLRTLKAGDTVSVPTSPSMIFSIRNVREFSDALREVTESYKELGIEPRVLELTLPKSESQKPK